MNIQYALVSCNTHPHFTAYWPIVAAAWLKLGIIPVCLFVLDDPSRKLPTAPENSIVHTIPPLSDVHIMPQAAMLRFWASYLYPDAVVIISDMDFVPLSRPFFHTQLAAYPEHAYLHVQLLPVEYLWTPVNDIPEKITNISRMRYLQSSFHIAKGRMMHRILKLAPDWETTCKKILPYYLQEGAKITTGRFSHKSHKDAVPWFGDEIYTSIRLASASYAHIYYITHQEYQYSGPIWNIIPLVSENLSTKWDRFVGIHLPPPVDPEDGKMLAHLIRHGQVPRPQIIWWWYIRFWYQLINFTNTSMNSVKIIGPWTSLAVNILGWCVLHLLPPPKLYKRALLAVLWHKRTVLLAKHPSLKRFSDQLLSIKNVFSQR